MRRYTYTARVTTLLGLTVTCTVGGSTAMAALHNVKRSRKGDWSRIEVGLGEGAAFRALQAVSR